ncbi:MAG: response regulator transcription factor [Bacteroidales bacterium]|nr:response regulator transcription factor [Bacteroidales bacterium]
MNCIIVDDKRSSEHLERYVAKCSSLNLVGTFSDTVSAFDQISKRNNIDLAFVDISLAGIESFELFESLINPPAIIVVSSTDQHALKAFDLNVVDYLLKPVNFSRFCRAVDKSIRINTRNKSRKNDEKEVFIRKSSTLIRLKMKNIIYIEGRENYVILNTCDKRYAVHFTMKGIESQLPADCFIRVHRSFIINKKMIKVIHDNSLDLIVGDNLKNIPIGKMFRSQLLDDIFIMDKNSAATHSYVSQ